MTRDDPRQNGARWSPSFHLVALGASAGGLDSLRRFFDNLPADGPEAAYVVLMHLTPDRDSDLVPILAQHTPLSVHAVADGDEVQAGRIHVPPPGTRLTVEEGRFRVEQRSGPTDRVIDGLLSSVASAWGEWGVGVVLSGAGDDGSRGISRLHDAGGLTLAEESTTALFDAMPRNAVGTGHVDRVARPDVLARMMMRFLASSENLPDDAEGAEIAVEPLLSVILRKRGRDFRHYRSSMVWRRIDRRRQLNQCKTFQDYTDLVQEKEAELDELISDLVITVTRFFRDPEAWDRINESAVREVLDRKKDGDTVRLWVPGCASGEEAYSMAILFAEEIQARSLNVGLQVFATDINADCIEIARRGVYPLWIEDDVPAGFLDRHFDREGGHFRVLKTDRQRIVFSVHDLLTDPPFAHMDLVSCRNLFIYLKPEAQQRALSYFHYALDGRGFLVLGASESIHGADSLFQPLARGLNVFRRVEGSEVADFRFPTTLAGVEVPQFRADSDRFGTAPIELSGIARRILLRRYGPAAVLVNEQRKIVYVLGDLSPYIETPSGPLETRVMYLVRPELAPAVRAVLEGVEEDGVRFLGDTVPLEIRGAPGRVRVAGHAVRPREGSVSHILVVFEELEAPNPEGGAPGDDAEVPSGEREMEAQLVRARAELRAGDARREAANEELRSANEELVSVNEELQSMNEELSTAKEELQSMNEELETINDELDHRVIELRRANSNMENLLASTQIATLFLDRDLRILSHSSPATKLFNLIESDRGRPLGDISHSLDVTDLEGSMRSVLATQEPLEEVVRDRSAERVFSLRILPYWTPTDVIDGLVVTLVDITELKAAETRAGRLGAAVQVSKNPMIIVTADGTIEVWNPGAAASYGYPVEEAIGMNMSRLVPEDDQDAFRKLLDQAAELGCPTEMETRRITKDGTVLEVWTTLTVVQEDGEPRIAFAERDVTNRARAARHRELLLRELDHRVKNTLATVQAIADRTLASDGSSPEEFVEAFQGRLGALGRVHKELSEVRWEGLDLDRLVQGTLEPYVLEGKATHDGPLVLLPVHITLPLAMAFHELATNAAKYGALSAEEGRVEVNWTSEPGGRLLLRWRERGGPSVREPAERGFGMTFLERGLAYQIDAVVETDFGPEGFSCSVAVPLNGGEPEPLLTVGSAGSNWDPPE